MTYAETLAYLYARLPMFQRIGKAAYKADLANTHALMDLTGHPEHGLRCVHIAGTNGKGSTSHMLASILQEAGYKVGLHTSPHLKDFRERFRFNGMVVPKETVVRFVEEHREVFEPIDASFFEWGVAFAFWWFRKEKVDIAVIETGMGGRLDSTNVIAPEVSVITNIGWDHMDFLGTTLQAIAGEKAGIIKPGVPVVVGEAQDEVAAVFQARANACEASITYVDQEAPLPYPVALVGAHQQRNARTVLATIDRLKDRGWNIPDDAVRRGLEGAVQNTGLMGRWQTISTDPLTIVDVAHNVDGFRVLNEQLGRMHHKHLHVVLGMVGDKEIGRALDLLPKHATYYYCKADIPRGLDAILLQEQAAACSLQGAAHTTVAVALAAAHRAAGPGDLVLVTGSVFVVAEVI
ncbi:MAG: bifunctional folylpolyglutamate synthase/dihydrofolate synthase [Flavobacteriales bacterium]|nr:bifunctional folylpolyglutamate synthase/dihydrofolate synthase [Flavobacteriales bacterium]